MTSFLSRIEPDSAMALERPSVPALDAILGRRIPVLDHGFVRVIDYMGDEAAIVQAARVSYGKGTKGVSDDTGLIRYLLRHWHSTPFEMASIKLHLKLPIFVMRQVIRHRTAKVNEYSARYSIVKDEFYFPELDRIQAQDAVNKQGSSGMLPEGATAHFLCGLEAITEAAYRHYEWAVQQDGEDHDHPPIARETARIGLPVNGYTEAYWKIDLHNWMHFLRLRNDSHAQWEARQFAGAMTEILELWMPNVHRAWLDYRKNAVTLSGPAVEGLRALLNQHLSSRDEAVAFFKGRGLGLREIQETIAAITGDVE